MQVSLNGGYYALSERCAEGNVALLPVFVEFWTAAAGNVPDAVDVLPIRRAPLLLCGPGPCRQAVPAFDNGLQLAVHASDHTQGVDDRIAAGC